MRILHVPKKAQPKAVFDDGKIEERRLVNFPDAQDGLLNSFSTLFYWAYAWGNSDGLIAEHPHRGFEIMSVVIDGTLEHYDNSTQEWTALHAGDVQVMQTGSGISHAERVSEGTHFFQIWFDPNIREALNKAPQYRDIRAEEFETIQLGSMDLRMIAGDGAAVELDAEARIFELSFGPGEHSLEVDHDSVFAMFVIDGKIETDASFIKKNDFVLVSHAEILRFSTDKPGRLIVVEVPQQPSYSTLTATD